MKPILFILLLFFFGAAYAQGVVNGPKDDTYYANIKVDGKINDWDENNMVFNNHIVATYALANDENNLYLVLKVDNKLIRNKMMLGGVVFTVNTSGQKEKGGLSITYPVIGKKEIEMSRRNTPVGMFRQSTGKMDEEEVKRHNDSLFLLQQKKFLGQLKFIRVKGIPQVTDSLLSIYNTEGIRVKMLVNENRHCNYELAIPLKYLRTPNNSKTIYYNVQFPGASINKSLPPLKVQGNNPPPPLGEGGVDLRTLGVSTDFWGKYTLSWK